MSDPAIEVAPTTPVASPAKAKKEKKPKTDKPTKPKAPKTHPPVSEMVVNAVKTLKERGGSSLQAIKKFLVAQYKVDTDKLAPFIKKFLKSAVEKGQLLQTKGKGASGSFKLPAAAKKEKVVKPKVAAVKKVAAKPKKAGVKKTIAKKPKAATATKIKKPVAKTTKKPATVKPVVKKVAPKPKAAPKAKVAPKPKVATKPKKAASPKAKKPAAEKKPKAAKKPAAKKA
ncbi:hypothetical protein ACKWTF_003976 [Chironomus riparius]